VEPVQPVSVSSGGWTRPAGTSAIETAAGAGTVGQSVGLQNESATSITMSTSNVTTVYSRVDSLMNSVGLDLENNQMLRMILAFMIMQALFAQEDGNQQMRGFEMLGGGLGQMESHASFLSMQSETNVVQIQHQSSTLSTAQAVQSLGSDGSEGSEGGRLDTVA
jgi:hypothetical protein